MRTAICAIAKNEQWYINDWIEYHLKLGIDHIYLYDNNEADNVGKYIDYAFKDRVTLIDAHGERQVQTIKYNECFQKHHDEYDWMAFIDVDEFITLADDKTTLKSVLKNQAYTQFDNIRMNWVIYSGGEDLYGDLNVPVYKRFTNRLYASKCTKSFVNCSRHCDVTVQVHAAHRTNPYYTINGCTPNGVECFQSIGRKDRIDVADTVSITSIDVSVMYVRHYITKSAAEYKVAKYRRSDAAAPYSVTDEQYFFKYNKKTKEKEDLLKKGSSVEVRGRLEKGWTRKPKQTICRSNSKQKAMDLFLRQTRFDMIFKYLYARNRRNSFVKDSYLASIQAFNGFHENNDGSAAKHGVIDFVSVFDELEHKCKYADLASSVTAPVSSSDSYLLNASHRVAICAAFDKCIDVEEVHKDQNPDYGYSFFRRRGLSEEVMDFGAIEYVKLNHNAYIVNVFPCVSETGKLDEVERILSKYGKIYYSKTLCNVSFNALVNINKICYGERGQYDKWIGNVADQYLGAQENARRKFKENGSLQIYVFICHRAYSLKLAKEEIRRLFGIGNYSVHINDTHEGSVRLAQTYFNRNTFNYIQNVDFKNDTAKFDGKIEKFKQKVKANSGNLDDFLLVGSTPLEAYLLRDAKDVDFLSRDDKTASLMAGEDFSPHDSQLKYYPTCKSQLIENPRNYFYYKNVKILTLENLYQMKQIRNEIGKDDVDCALMSGVCSK